jgi:hypothetical protein
MNPINEFLRTLKEIRQNKFTYLIMFYQLVFVSNLVRQLTTDTALVVNIVLMLALCFKTRKITKRENNLFLLTIGGFILINIAPTIMFGLAPKLFLGFACRIFFGFLIVVYFKHNFFEVFEKSIFALAFISLPLFLIQIIHLPFFDIFEGFSNLVLTDERISFGHHELSGHRYMIVFLVNSWAEFRNSGFMWEPAGFGFMLAWASLINLFVHRFVLNPRLIVIFIAALTTFSIGTYIYFSIIIIVYLTRNLKKGRGFLFLFLIVAILSASYRFDFVQRNIEMFERKIYSEQVMIEKIDMGRMGKRVSRVGGAWGNIHQIIKTPFGYGANYEFDDFFYDTPNGLIVLLRNWGIFSLVIILYCSYRVVEKLSMFYGIKTNLFHLVLLMMIVILPIAGNPISNRPFLFAFLLSCFVFRSKSYADRIAKNCSSKLSLKGNI